MESKVEARSTGRVATADPLAAEIGELGTLVKQLAETVAGARARADATGAACRGAGMPPAAVAPAARRVEPAMPAAPPSRRRPREAGRERASPASSGREPATAIIALIRSAIDANRIDLYLQPIVTLPQRKVRYYEAMSRLRTRATARSCRPPISSTHAEAAGLMPKIDNLVLFRCVQVVRRLLLKNREIGLFCNVAGSTLTRRGLFQQLLEFMDANRAHRAVAGARIHAGRCARHGADRERKPAALAERGFRFSLDNVTDLRIEPRELAERGFRFVKVPATLLLNRTGAAATDIHPADLSDLLGRFGIDLIAEKIESEGMVVDLLDYDVRFGQGFLFSPPRPVRAEALQGIADRGDVIARDAAPRPTPAGAPASSQTERRQHGLDRAPTAARPAAARPRI